MSKIWSALVKSSYPRFNRVVDDKMLSGYITVFNAESMEFPYVESIKSMLGFCDEVVVVDGGSTDGTAEKILAINDPKLRFVVNKWDENVPGMDGQQKQFARNLCKGSFLWQQDADEVVHEDDYQKIRDLVTDFPEDVEVLHLPVIELWGGVENVRCDRHTWKWRLSRNSPFIAHGINRHAKFEKNGKVYARRGSSDGCEYINPLSGEFCSHRGHYTSETEYARRYDVEKYAEMCNADFSKYPAIFHYSLANIPRKIKNYVKFWGKQWDSLYGEEKFEHPFFNGRDFKTITDAEIIQEAQKVLATGNPEISFYKHATDTHGTLFSGKVPLFKLKRNHPEVMKKWIEKCNSDMELCK